MATGIFPKYSQDLPLEGLTAQQFLYLAMQSAGRNGWRISQAAANSLKIYTDFSWLSWSEKINIIIEGDTARITSACTNVQITDWGKNKRNVRELLQGIAEAKNMLQPEDLAEKAKTYSAPAHDDEEILVPQQPAVRGVFSVFKPGEGYFITPILISINILVFIAMCLAGANVWQPDSQILVSWGANFRPVTLNNGWWRLITCCFLHVGILHLLLNMYALMCIGLLLEPLLGARRFLLAYVLTGITGSLMSLYWHDFMVSAGASGAIFGMYGVFLAMLTTNLIERTARRSFLASTLIFVGYNLMNGIEGNIDNAAHIGGLLGGLFMGYLFYPVLKNPQEKTIRNSVSIGAALLVLIIGSIVYISLDNDVLTFQKGVEEFSKKEKLALEVFDLPDGTDKKVRMKKLKYGMRLWFEGVAITKQANRLKLPPFFRNQNSLLQKYCYSRINTYNFICKSIEENDAQKYQSLIEQYNERTEQIIEQIKALNN